MLDKPGEYIESHTTSIFHELLRAYSRTESLHLDLHLHTHKNSSCWRDIHEQLPVLLNKTENVKKCVEKAKIKYKYYIKKTE